MSEKVKWPKISIVTPSYNQGKYIEETILSVIGQNYPNLEYIIIDGGSTDDTVKIIKKYEEHIAYWVSEPDRGQSNAINKGLAQCTGEIFNWLNSDDYLEKDALLAVAKTYIDFGSDLICGISRRFCDGEKLYDYVQTRIHDTIEKTIFHGSFRQGPSFFKADVVRKLGGVNDNFQYVMDSELYLRYLLKHGVENIKFLNCVLINFRLHLDSKTYSGKENFLREFTPVVEKLIQAKEPYQSELVDNNKLLAYYYAQKALSTSRYHLFSYSKNIFQSVIRYPDFSLNHMIFLLNNVIFYKLKHT